MRRKARGVITSLAFFALSMAIAGDDGARYSIKTVGDVIQCSGAGGRQRSVEVELDNAITIYQHPELHNSSVLVHFTASTDFAADENYVSGHGDFGIKIISEAQPTETHLTADNLSSSYFRLKPDKPSVQGHFIMVIPFLHLSGGMATGQRVGGMYFAVESGKCSFDG
jgi:hypothetical protein